MQMYSKLLTITIPSYNVEKYLDECLKSFVFPYDDPRLEVIVVDDGSTDRTKDIAIKYADKYPKTIKVISKKNGGHGSTINTGLKYATGKYFKVIDGDDYIDNSVLSKYLDLMERADEDVITNDKVDFIDGTEQQTPFYFGSVEYDKKISMENISEKWPFSIHRIALKTEIVRQNMPAIDEHCFYVDQEFVLYNIPNIKTLRASDAILYYYRIGNANQSISFENVYKRRGDLRRVIDSLLQFYNDLVQKSKNKKMKQYIETKIAEQIDTHITVLLSNPKTTVENLDYAISFKQMIKKEYSNIYAKLPFNKRLLVLKIIPKQMYLELLRRTSKH